MTDRMDLSSHDQGENFPATQLGRHLIRRFLAGQMNLDSHNGILRRFCTRASSDVAAHLM
jgi:hypothetical protein